jgi:hypothetical protein
MKRSKVFALWAAAILTSLAVMMGTAAPARGQGSVTTGTISVDVSDPNGAAVAGARVAARNQETSQTREGTTDQDGRAVFSLLNVGRYEITIEAKGFKKAVIRDTVVNVGSVITLPETLQIGGVTESVEVSAEQIAPIETEKTEVSTVIQSQQVRELPLNQRSFTALVTQEAGIVTLTNTSGNANQTPTSVAFAQGSQISANGQVSQSMAYLVDGVNINNTGFGAPGTAAGGDVPGVESIQEFQILSHNYSAAYGGSAGAVVSFATRSGGNQFHGNLYEFLRNEKLDALAFFDHQVINGEQIPKPPFKRNQFGGTIGGPIKKDKTFFFANYEALRQRLTTTSIGNVPTDCARNGGVDGSCEFPVVDEFGNPVAISSGVQAILAQYPHANGTDFGNGIAQYIFPNQQPVRQDFGLVRFDHAISNKDNFMGRYSITDAEGSNAYFLPSYSFAKYNRLQSLILKWTRTINSNLTNTASFGFVRSLTQAVVSPTSPPDPAAYTGNPAREVVGTISVGSATSGNTSGSVSTIGLDNWGPFRGGNNTFPINDDLIYTHGKHTVRVGGEIVPHQWNWDKGNLNGGGWTFNSLNDLLAGNPAVLIIKVDSANPHWKFRTKQFAWYAEDTWRLKSNLTVTLGLRHEFQAPVLSETHGRLGNVSSRESADVVAGAPYHNYSLKQFQPRIGISWDPFKDGKTVVRTGFGLFNDFIPLEAVAGELSYNDPNPTLNAFFGAPIAPGGLPEIPFPNCMTVTLTWTTPCTVATGYPGLLTGVLEKVRAPTSAQWNLGVERQLPGGVKVGLSYAGSSTWNILRGIEGNSSLPCSVDANGNPYFGPSVGACGTAAPAILSKAFTLYAVTSDAHSSYHAGTLSVSRTFGKSLGFNTSLTWAKAISESDTNNSGAILLGNASHSEDPLNRHVDRSESLISFRRRFTGNMVYSLPFGSGQRYLKDAHGITQGLFGGWQFNMLAEVRDGAPFSVLAGFGITNVGDALTYPDRPNQLRPNPVLGNPNLYYDPKAYALQDPGYLGTATRNSVVSPGFMQWDMSFGKKFQIGERSSLQFRAEIFNFLNHANFDLPANQLYVQGAQFTGPTPPTQAQVDALPCNLTLAQAYRASGPASGYSCNPQAGLITRTVGIPRQIQFGLKYTF